GNRYTCPDSAPSQFAHESSSDLPGGSRRPLSFAPIRRHIGTDAVIGALVEPVDLAHLADDHELVPVGAHGAVIVKAVGELDIAPNHVGRLHVDPGHRVVDATPLAGDLRADGVHVLLLVV